MSNEYDAPPPMTSDAAVRMAQALAEAGVVPEEIQAHMKSAHNVDIGALVSEQTGSQWRLNQLKSDPEFVAALNSGDAEANALFNSLAMKIALGDGSTVAPAAPKAEDYKFDLRRIADNELAQRMQTESAQWAADLKLPGNVASAVVDFVLETAQQTEAMGPDEKVNHGEQQLTQLRSVLAKSSDPDARLKNARETLKRASGRDIDIAAVARSSGARVALELVLHADGLAMGKR